METVASPTEVQRRDRHSSLHLAHGAAQRWLSEGTCKSPDIRYTPAAEQLWEDIDWAVGEMLDIFSPVLKPTSPVTRQRNPSIDWAVFEMLEKFNLDESDPYVASEELRPAVASVSAQATQTRKNSTEVLDAISTSETIAQAESHVSVMEQQPSVPSPEIHFEIFEQIGIRVPPAPLPMEKTLFLENVEIDSEDVLGSGSYLAGLLAEMQVLGEENFDENTISKLVEMKRSKHPWKLLLLGRRPAPQEEGAANDSLLGFLVYQHCIGTREFVILRIAVPLSLRGCGYGKRLMSWAFAFAKKLPRAQCGSVALSALAEAVPFYRRLGFHDCNNSMQKKLDAADDFCLTPGQVYMKYKLGRASQSGKSSRKTSKD